MDQFEPVFGIAVAVAGKRSEITTVAWGRSCNDWWCWCVVGILIERFWFECNEQHSKNLRFNSMLRHFIHSTLADNLFGCDDISKTKKN